MPRGARWVSRVTFPGPALHSLFQKLRLCTTAHVEFDAGKSKHRKVPALKGWTQITPKQSHDLLATRKFGGHRFDNTNGGVAP